MSCRPVTFQSITGEKLFGIVHFPEAGAYKSTPVILLSPGIKSRVGPHRLYVKLARQLSEMGYVVLRFDFSALGDSEGVVEESMVADFYGSVQTGRYIDDTRAAMDWMQREYRVSRFILCGLCGGALTGLLAAAQDHRAESLFGFAIPVILDSTKVDATKYLTSGELNAWRKGYLRNLTSWKSWLRLLTFRSNYRVLLRALLAADKPERKSGRLGTSERVAEQANFNPLFPGAFEAMVRSRKMLLVFSEADRLWSIYQERFAIPYSDLIEAHKGNLEVHLVKEANHIFSFKEWQQDLFDRITLWLQQNY